MALPKQYRLRSRRDFAQVHRKGLRTATQHLAVRALKRPPPIDKIKIDKPDQDTKQDTGADGGSFALSSCFGVSISRKVSKRAVVRNRIKRQLLAIIQHNLAHIEPGWQVVIVVRPPAVECEFDDFFARIRIPVKKK